MLEGGIRFTKMQAFGNDYVYIDAISQKIDSPKALAVQMSNRHFGVGSDGLVLICASDRADFRMRIFNHDGSEAEMCGNAVRSVAKFVYHYGMTDKTEFCVETLGGVKDLVLHVDGGVVKNITADIGQPVFDGDRVPVIAAGGKLINEPVTLGNKTFYATAMSLGNPHCVCFTEDVNELDLAKYGQLMENHAMFPQKANVEFCEVLSRGRLRLRTWERNTGETLACGTGCCACVTAGVLADVCDAAVEVEQLGGVTSVSWDEDTKRLLMTAPSEIVFEGVWRVSSIDTGEADKQNRLQNFAGRA